MKIYIFNCQNDMMIQGYTDEETGSKLPINDRCSNWKFLMLSPVDPEKSINPKHWEVANDISETGYHIGNITEIIGLF